MGSFTLPGGCGGSMLSCHWPAASLCPLLCKSSISLYFKGNRAFIPTDHILCLYCRCPTSGHGVELLYSDNAYKTHRSRDLFYSTDVWRNTAVYGLSSEVPIHIPHSQAFYYWCRMSFCHGTPSGPPPYTPALSVL